MKPYTIHSVTTGKLQGAPSARLVAAWEALLAATPGPGTPDMRAYLTMRTNDPAAQVWEAEPDASLGYSDTATVYLRSVEASS